MSYKCLHTNDSSDENHWQFLLSPMSSFGCMRFGKMKVMFACMGSKTFINSVITL